MPSPYDLGSKPMEMQTPRMIARSEARAEIEKFLDGLEDRLAIGMQKALDTVTGELEERLKAIEEDQAKILRHLGLDR